jgi:hypothetical protein
MEDDRIDQVSQGVCCAKTVENGLLDSESVSEIIKNTGYYLSSFILSIESKIWLLNTSTHPLGPIWIFSSAGQSAGPRTRYHQAFCY